MCNHCSEESGDNAQKVAAMDLECGFLQRKTGNPARKVSLVYVRKENYVKYKYFQVSS